LHQKRGYGIIDTSFQGDPEKQGSTSNSTTALIRRRNSRGFTHITLIAMQEGTIARLTDKGFGFIKVEGRDKDLFFHSNELVNCKFDELQEGDKMTFEIAESPKGPNAVKVSRA